jgi:cytochrome d ubiquinol oxidase subunit I
VLPVFLSFRAMVGFAFLFLAVGLYAWLRRDRIESQTRFLKVLPWLIPLPYLANQLGWTIAELGRQPWIVYGIMRTRDAVSPIAVGQAATSLGAFFLVYALLGAVDFYLLFTYARRGPAPAAGPERGAVQARTGMELAGVR